MQAEMIDFIKFTLISPEEIKKLSVAKITIPDTYNEDGYPIDGGLVDQRLGVIDPGLKCKTCGGKAKVCPGHFGHIDLVRPVIHPEFAKIIYMLLHSTCSTCHRLLLTPEKVKEISDDIKSFISMEDPKDTTLILGEDDRNALIKQLRTIKKCPHCGAQQPKIKFERPTYFYINNNKVNADEIREWLSKIPDEDIKLIGIDPTATRPEWFILTTLLVPPVNVRPSITLDSGERSEDDLTHKIVDIIRSNQRLEQDIDAGAPQIIIDDLWELLQYQITTYFNNETPGVPVARHRTTKPLKTLVQRLKGKEGILRNNLSGKRVNFSARSVISVDPFLSINQVGVPKKIADVLTLPVYVTNWNIEECKKMLNDKEERPIVNFILPGGLRKRVTDVNIEELTKELKPGIILEKKLADNDLILFNRQPTLHRISIMAHEVKVVPSKTLRLNVEITEPYNADFDGDEMNVHLPQSLEAQAEARYLMQPKNQLLSPRDGRSLVTLSEDELIGLYWLTKDDSFFSKEEAVDMLSSIEIYELPKKEKNGKYSGKSIVSLILPKDLNIEIQGIIDKTKIVNGKLVEGILDVKSCGGGDAKLIQEIYIKYGPDVTKDFLLKISKLALYVSASKGMTLSVKDYYPSDEMLNERENVLNEVFKKNDEIYSAYKNKKLEPFAGYTRKETYELLTLAQLDEARSLIEKGIKKYLTFNDKAFLVAAVRARGNITNFIQITMFLGQQSIRGERPSRGYKGRVLPYFEKGDVSPKAKGFVSSGFLDGMDPIELYMHSIGSRDAAMGKSLLTAVSGYLQRRLMNALQDIYVKDDLSARDASGAIIQTIYGGDGLDPIKIKFAEKMKDDNEFVKVVPGEPVGVVAAQSIGEPSTQMLLRVFHAAGIGSVVTTKGVPRVIELIDGRTIPTNPTMTIKLKKDVEKDYEVAKKVWKSLEEVRLSNVIKDFNENFREKTLTFNFDNEKLEYYGLTSRTILNKISKMESLEIVSSEPEIKVKYKGKGRTIYNIRVAFNRLLSSILFGIDGIKKAEIRIDKKTNAFYIVTFGSNLEEIMKRENVDPMNIYCNNPFEVLEFYGIGAARNIIANELKEVIEEEGLTVNFRHIGLIADTMTYTGKIRSVGRHGIAGEKESVFARAAYEETIKHFTNACVFGEKDYLKGVSENILVGKQVNVGTGTVNIVIKKEDLKSLKQVDKKEK